MFNWGGHGSVWNSQERWSWMIMLWIPSWSYSYFDGMFHRKPNHHRPLVRLHKPLISGYTSFGVGLTRIPMIVFCSWEKWPSTRFVNCMVKKLVCVCLYIRYIHMIVYVYIYISMDHGTQQQYNLLVSETQSSEQFCCFGSSYGILPNFQRFHQDSNCPRLHTSNAMSSAGEVLSEHAQLAATHLAAAAEALHEQLLDPESRLLEKK